MPDQNTPRPTVLCALEHERAALVRAGVETGAEVVCCGPGAANIVAWTEREGVRRERVILAGIAGSLRETCNSGEAFIAATVLSATGGQYQSAAEIRHADGGSVRRVVVTSADEVVTSPGEKRALAEKTGADLVDLESAVFAEAAGIFGWRWAIVRGVSDGANESLPHGIGRWVDARGRTRILVVMLAILRRPWIIPTLFRLRSRSKTAMKQVAEIVTAMLRSDQAP